MKYSYLFLTIKLMYSIILINKNIDMYGDRVKNE